MNVYIDKRAEEYIKSNSKDHSIKLYLEKFGGGWCVGHQLSVKIGKPSNIDSFNLYKVGDIDVYIASGMKTRNNEVKIGLSKILWVKALYADGLMIQ